MSGFKKYILISRIMIIIELTLFVFTVIIFQILQNIVVGIYYTLFVVSLFLWITLLILTIMLYLRAKKKI
ncbi:MAG: hypothetical protein EAX91_14140 [Candidatus Lokiarchaeota archaeon]|nr:hypothetical protein [Candidatus Lokiarchaeota archaeon]